MQEQRSYAQTFDSSVSQPGRPVTCRVQHHLVGVEYVIVQLTTTLVTQVKHAMALLSRVQK